MKNNLIAVINKSVELLEHTKIRLAIYKYHVNERRRA